MSGRRARTYRHIHVRTYTKSLRIAIWKTLNNIFGVIQNFKWINVFSVTMSNNFKLCIFVCHFVLVTSSSGERQKQRRMFNIITCGSVIVIKRAWNGVKRLGQTKLVSMLKILQASEREGFALDKYCVFVNLTSWDLFLRLCLNIYLRNAYWMYARKNWMHWKWNTNKRRQRPTKTFFAKKKVEGNKTAIAAMTTTTMSMWISNEEHWRPLLLVVSRFHSKRRRLIFKKHLLFLHCKERNR